MLLDKILEYKNPLVVFCIGIITGLTFYLKDFNLVILFLIAFVVLILLAWQKNIKILFFVIALLVGYFYTFAYFKIFTKNLDFLLGKNCIFIGEIVSPPDETSIFNRKYFFKTLKIIDKNNQNKIIDNVNSKVQVFGSNYEEYEVGDIAQITGKLKYPKRAKLPGLFDERSYLLTKGVHYILKAESGTLLFLDLPGCSIFTRKIAELRKTSVKLNEINISCDNSALINAITFGSKAAKLSGDLNKKIRDLGLSHITSASGFNVAVLSAGIFFICLLFARNLLLPTVLTFIAVLLYSSIAEFSGSIIRAAVFIILILGGNLINKKLKVLPALSFLVILFFFHNPLNLLDAGLQLSVFSFSGIVLFYQEFTRRFKDKLNWLYALFFQSLFAQIMVMPLIVFYFHNIQLLGLISNLVAVPAASVILILGLLNVLFHFIPGVSLIFVWLLNLSSGVLLHWIDLLYKVPLKVFYIPNIDFLTLILLYLFIFYFLVLVLCGFFNKKTNFILISLLALVLFSYSLSDRSKYLKVYFIAKYNQDAILLDAPGINPVYFSTRIDDHDKEMLSKYFQVHNVHKEIQFYDLRNSKPVKRLNTLYLSEVENKIVINYGNLKLDILKSFNGNITQGCTCVKLPLLRKSDPPLSSIFLSFPDYVIVNDYKRLSRKSKKEIVWLRSIPPVSYFLSETGTIALVSDGKKYDIVFE